MLSCPRVCIGAALRRGSWILQPLMNEWPQLEFITEGEANGPKHRTGWETVRFELEDEETTDEEVTKDFFVSFVTSW